ncbi:olefin beta-lactone synthetase [Moritella sp. Urea-trap-13]|uniref:olefin beta-lactone synthetase n=1 Tax=Moritella sp. Urea-trap-13 TaxID=2058327 RepID=UPI000C332DB4|nr:fatty acid CoA ligase family protein [Moritella sp. Urea-trap-13]PKH05966.1 peptide synthase [Moritella sp. Urea-trap-13]
MTINTTPEAINFCHHLSHAAFATPDSLAVAVQRSRKDQLFYDEIDLSALNQQSDELAYALNAYGITRGMKAVLMVTPSIDFFILTFALFKAGIVPILVDPGMGVRNLKQCFSESTPDAFIGIPKAHLARKLFGWGKPSVKLSLTVGGCEKLSRLTGQMSLGRLLTDHRASIAEQEQEPVKLYPIALFEPSELCAILFTSGSTGVPKGVVYSHQMFEGQIQALRDDYGIKPGERDLSTFPLFSLFGPALGMASIVPDMDASKPITANPDFIFAAIEKYQCSNLFANPALIEILGQAGSKQQPQLLLTSLKRVISAGAPATLSSISHFTRLLKTDVEVWNSYGATESLPLTKIGSKALLTMQDVTDNGGGICVGQPIKDVEVAIIAITEDVITDWHDDLTLASNQIGEIVVKGQVVSQGYYHRDAATQLAKIKDSASTELQPVFRHRMGDLGYLDAQGQLWMCGRKAHSVITPSQPYFSIPCERIFNTHEQVKRTALVGIQYQGETIPLLCVELKDDSAISTEQLFGELQEIGSKHQQTAAISAFLVHPNFPVDIRHNAKIFREKLALWAQKQAPYNR